MAHIGAVCTTTDANDAVVSFALYSAPDLFEMIFENRVAARRPGSMKLGNLVNLVAVIADTVFIERDRGNTFIVDAPGASLDDLPGSCTQIRAGYLGLSIHQINLVSEVVFARFAYSGHVVWRSFR